MIEIVDLEVEERGVESSCQEEVEMDVLFAGDVLHFFLHNPKFYEFFGERDVELAIGLDPAYKTDKIVFFVLIKVKCAILSKQGQTLPRLVVNLFGDNNYSTLNQLHFVRIIINFLNLSK